MATVNTQINKSTGQVVSTPNAKYDINTGKPLDGGSGGSTSTPTTVIRNAPQGFDLAPGSSVSGYYDYSGNATNPIITPADLTPTSPIPVPTKAPLTDYTGTVKSGNAGLGIGANTKTDTVVDTALAESKKLFDDYLKDSTPPPSLSNEYLQMEKDAGIAEKQRLVNDYTAQLNTIEAESEANKLKLVGQGRGIPEVIIGGQQAQVEREAAIRALPVQAQLAAAQGSLDFAKSRLDTLFKLKSEDLTVAYNYKKDLRDAVYSFQTEQQRIKTAALQKADDRAYEEKQNNLQLINEWGKVAIEYGQSSLVSSIARLDVGSPTFQTDLGKITTQLRKPVSTTGNGGSGSVTSTGKFTQTQLNKGIAFSGLPEEQFKNLSYEAQTVFVNKGSQLSKLIEDFKSELNNGVSTLAELKSEIDDSTQPDEIKTWFKNQLDAVQAKNDADAAANPGFFTKVKNFFGNLF